MNKNIQPIEEFKNLKGRININTPLASSTWFQVGGPADYIYKPTNQEDLISFLNQLPENTDVLPLGVGSNVIIRDGGYRGAVIKLGRNFNFVEHENDALSVGAATLDINLAKTAAEKGMAGLSFMAGIPGTLGGAVCMNAGAYHGETKDFLAAIDIIVKEDDVWASKTFKRDQIDMQYRHTDLPDQAIVTKAVFKGMEERAPELLNQEIEEIQKRRAETQPIREKTGGSTFANPSVEDLIKADISLDMKTWQLIDAVEGRGYRVGGAHFSEKHCNFLINDGTATANDIEKCGEDIKSRVYSRFGLTLRWEIKRIGDS